MSDALPIVLDSELLVLYRSLTLGKIQIADWFERSLWVLLIFASRRSHRHECSHLTCPSRWCAAFPMCVRRVCLCDAMCARSRLMCVLRTRYRSSMPPLQEVCLVMCLYTLPYGFKLWKARRTTCIALSLARPAARLVLKLPQIHICWFDRGICSRLLSSSFKPLVPLIVRSLTVQQGVRGS
jgi:hypothetical protein